MKSSYLSYKKNRGTTSTNKRTNKLPSFVRRVHVPRLQVTPELRQHVCPCLDTCIYSINFYKMHLFQITIMFITFRTLTEIYDCPMKQFDFNLFDIYIPNFLKGSLKPERSPEESTRAFHKLSSR